VPHLGESGRAHPTVLLFIGFECGDKKYCAIPGKRFFMSEMCLLCKVNLPDGLHIKFLPLTFSARVFPLFLLALDNFFP